MLEIKMANGNIARIKRSEIAAVNTAPGFDNELTSVIMGADLVLRSGMIVGIKDTKAKIKEAINAMVAF